MDHSEKVHREPEPRQKANILSLITFVYTGQLFSKGFKKDLEDDDLYEVTKKCRSQRCTDQLEQAYLGQVTVKGPDKKVSAFKILWNLYGLRYIGLGLFHMSGRLITSTMEPEAVSNLVGYFKPGQTKMTMNDAIYFAGIMIGCKAFHTIYFHNYMVYLSELAIQVRISFSSLIYRKAIKLSPKALEKTSLGNIVTILTKDINQFEHAIHMFNDLWISVIQTFLMCYLIYRRIGSTCMIGVFMLVSLIPVQALVSRLVKRLRLKMAKRTDERIQRTQESLATIKTIKMYTWEQVFADKIGEARFKELRTMVKSAYSKASLRISGMLVGKLSFYATIMVYIYLYNDMSAEDIFYLMSMFGRLNFSISGAFSRGFTKLGELSASLERINHVLELEELDEFVDKPDDDPQIDLRNVSVNLQKKDILKNINLKLERGLNIVTGQLGSGKSSLIKVVLRDYPIEEGGEVRTRGRKSYASQDPWLFPSSIKQNILFGEKFNDERYQQVVAACALEYDFSILEKGDETIVADRGMNLSKGQQARINLARAIYKDSDIYLIDDALTALDSKVQEYIFTHCIQGLLKDKCVVLVTHNAKHIQQANTVVILEDGAVKYLGEKQNLSSEQFEILTEIVEPETPETKKSKEATEEEDSNEKTKLLGKPKPQLRRRQVYHENKKTGSVGFKLYGQYLKMGGGFFICILLLLSYLSCTFIGSTSQKMLSVWINQRSFSQATKEKYLKNTTIDLDLYHVQNETVFLNDTFSIPVKQFEQMSKLEMKAAKSINLYQILILTSAVLDLVKEYLILKFGFTASVNVHKAMINRILAGTMVFFDSFFIGNILNRFAQDLNVIDEHLPMTLSHAVDDIFHLGGVLGLLMSVDWKLIIPAIALAIFAFLMRTIYIRTARSLKRLEAATRSPIVGHLNSTMDGLTTIRAFKAQTILKQEFDKHQDLYTSAVYSSICSRSAFSFTTEISAVLFLSSVVIRFLFFGGTKFAGDVGLALTQAGHLSMIINNILGIWSEVENTMTSTERAMEYTTIDNETKEGAELDHWPNKGEIHYKSVSLKYANSQDKVLKDISFTVQPNTKIGIVGRTGAGKSTIISTLYRLYNYEGEIYIDGVELKTLSLKYLRQHISIIPQDPIMFSGSVRSNVDPLEEFTDEEIWKTLHKVHLDTRVPNLQTQVGDINFSTGQRQLICLARAIIRKNKIVVLDEATANMDPETEQLAQSIVEQNFSSCTILIIAHRLDAILECDKVIVMNRGEIVEFDKPSALLENPKSLFSEMMRNAKR